MSKNSPAARRPTGPAAASCVVRSTLRESVVCDAFRCVMDAVCVMRRLGSQRTVVASEQASSASFSVWTKIIKLLRHCAGSKIRKAPSVQATAGKQVQISGGTNPL
jgi:hypothetical protein